MSMLDEITPSPRKVMTLFYLVDTSESMKGEVIGTLNSAMEESIPLLKEVAVANDDAEIRVAILQFSSGCSWITPLSGPVGLDDLVWNDLQPGGITDLGAAFIELDKKLSRNEYLNSQTGAYAPVILLITDGAPTDNWKKGLEVLKKNNWFKHAIKIAIDIHISAGADKSVLEAFTGNSEAIISAKDRNILKKMIHKISVRASEFQSHSKQAVEEMSSPEDDSANIVNEVVSEAKTEMDDNTSVSSNDEDWGQW